MVVVLSTRGASGQGQVSRVPQTRARPAFPVAVCGAGSGYESETDDAKSNV